MRKLKVFFILSAVFIFSFLIRAHNALCARPSIINFNLCALVFNFSDAAINDEITEKQKQIEELERQINEYQGQILQKQGEARSLQNEISKLNSQVSKIQLEIKSLDLNIQQTNLEIKNTEQKIKDTGAKIAKLKEGIASFIRLVDANDQESLVEILIKNKNLSDFFNNVENIKLSQEKAKTSVISLRSFKKDLEEKERELEEQKDEQIQLRRLQEFEKKNLDFKKTEKNSLLKETKGQESKFQDLVKRSQQDIERIREQISFLIQHGVSVEDAIKFGQLAAIRLGIRPEFLLAILEVESGLGRNVGSGNWLEDMYQCYVKLGKRTKAEAEKNAFLQIISKLGLDPNSVRVSREPYYGCGGAMGPAQFLPTTWLGYEEEVTRLTGRNPPNPWNIEDAFFAAAAKLVRGGAGSKETKGETRAAKAYVSGNPNCTKRICNTYSRAVLRKAEELAKSL